MTKEYLEPLLLAVESKSVKAVMIALDGLEVTLHTVQLPVHVDWIRNSLAMALSMALTCTQHASPGTRRRS